MKSLKFPKSKTILKTGSWFSLLFLLFNCIIREFILVFKLADI